MYEISTEIEINASKDQIWNLLIDIEKWQEWNPIIKSASGKLEKGEKISLIMVGKDGKNGPAYSPIITDLEDHSKFRWRAKMLAGFIFTNDKVIELEEVGVNRTKLIHKELFKGIMFKMMCSQMDKGVPPMLNSMNKAIKDKLEI